MNKLYHQIEIDLTPLMAGRQLVTNCLIHLSFSCLAADDEFDLFECTHFATKNSRTNQFNYFSKGAKKKLIRFDVYLICRPKNVQQYFFAMQTHTHTHTLTKRKDKDKNTKIETGMGIKRLPNSTDRSLCSLISHLFLSS